MEIPDAELSERLRAPHGVFVTLKKGGELRGCIGKMDFERPLWSNALDGGGRVGVGGPEVSAGDSRQELGEIAIEISILNPPEELPRPEMFDVTRHGIIVEKRLAARVVLAEGRGGAGLGRDEDAGDGVLEGGSSRGRVARSGGAAAGVHGI